MWPSLPQYANYAAGEAALGSPEAVFRARRSLSVPTVFAVLGAACVVALLLALLGAPVVGVVVLVLAAAVLGGLLSRPPASGRRWLATYEHGFVDVLAPRSGAPGLRTVRWSEVAGVEPGLTLVLGSGARVPLAGLAPRGQLASTVERHVPGRVDPALRQSWVAGDRRRTYRLWPALGALVLATLLLVAILPAVTGFAPSPSPSETPAAAERSYSTVIDSPLPPVYSEPEPSFEPTVPANGIPGIPISVYDYADVCKGKIFPDAPAYAGRPKHRVHVDVEARGHTAEYTLGDLSAWETTEPSEIQLVACVKYTLGSVLGTCSYRGTSGPIHTQTLRNATYEVWVRAVQTGKLVGHSMFRGNLRSCEETIFTYRGKTGSIQIARPSVAQLRSSIGRYVTG